MPRPKRPRHVISNPLADAFRPEGMEPRDEITLSLEEFEAIRLIDYSGMDQSQAAEIMNVSRQTVGRVLKMGRYKLSKSIVEALRLKVSGGCYTFKGRGMGQGHRRRGRGMGRNAGRQHSRIGPKGGL